MFVVDDLAAVLVEWLADAGRKKITTLVMGTDQQRALKNVAKLAVQLTINELCPRGGRSAELLNEALTSALRDPQLLSSGVAHFTLLEAFHARLNERIGRMESEAPGLFGTVVLQEGLPRFEPGVVIRCLGAHVIDLILENGARGGPLAPLASTLQRDAIYLQGKRIEGKVNDIADDVSRVLSFAHRGKSREPLTMVLPLGSPIQEIDPIDLGVHRAIRPSIAASEDLYAQLPRYVPRVHDARLRSLLSCAQGPSAVLLVGESSCGKTRACYEAVAHCLPDWLVVHPYDSDELLGYLRSGFVGPTVIWLDEAQEYLGDRNGKEIVVEIRRLMHRRDQDVVILGSMWPSYWRQFTKPRNQDRDIGGYSDVVDFGHVARFLELAMVYRVDVAGHFKPSESPEIMQLSRLAQSDPRLDTALRTAGREGKVTQILAGGVLLLDNYLKLGDPFTRAVVTAAMDARRLGYHSALPTNLLREAAEGYIGPFRESESDVGWFPRALESATGALHGVSALAPARGRPGTVQQDGYILHDYLDEYGRRARRGEPPAASLWDALAAWVTDPGDIARLHESARERHLYRHAALVAASGVRGRDPNAMTLFARSLREAEKQTEAHMLLMQAAKAGSAPAVEDLLKAARAVGSVSKTISWLLSVAPGQDAAWHVSAAGTVKPGEVPDRVLEVWTAQAAKRAPVTMRREAQRLHSVGRLPEALSWWTSAVQEGDETAIKEAFEALHDAGRLNDALAFCRWAADLGYSTAGIVAAGALFDLGRLDDAAAWYMWAGSAGDPYGIVNATNILLNLRREREAVRWLTELANNGNRYAIRRAADLLTHQQGNRAAVRWLDPLARSGNITAACCIARVLLRAGQANVSADWWQYIVPRLPLPEPRHRLKKSLNKGLYDGFVFSLPLDILHGFDPLRVEESYRYGNSALLRSAIAAHRKAGALEKVIAPLKDRGESGDSDAVREVVRVFIELRMRPEALRWLESLADHGDIDAMRRLANLYESWGNPQDAIRWWTRIADHGESFGAVRVARMYTSKGKIENSIRWWQRAVETASDVDRQKEWTATVAEQLRRIGRQADILPWIEQRVSAGDVPAFRTLVGHLTRSGRNDDALAVWQRMTILGISDRDTVLTGKEKEAFIRYGLTPDGNISPPWAPVIEEDGPSCAYSS